jgi:hypothetical protein
MADKTPGKEARQDTQGETNSQEAQAHQRDGPDPDDRST